MLKFKKEKLFYIGYILMLASQMFSSVNYIENYTKYITILGILFLIIYIFQNKYVKKDIAKLIFASIIIGIGALVGNDKNFLKLIILILAFQNINFKEFIKKDFKYRLIFLITVVILGLLGLTYINNKTRIGETEIRYSLGFQHPNTFALYTMILSLEIIYLFKNKEKILGFLFILTAFLLNYFLTDSRSVMIVELLTLIYILIPNKLIVTVLNKKIIKLGVTWSFLILLVLSLSLSLLYSPTNKNWIHQIDQIVSTRIKTSNYYLNKYSNISLFGKKIKEANKYVDNKLNIHHIPLDNGYIHLILLYGILTTILLTILLITSMKKLYSNKNYTLIFIMFILNFYLLMEATTLGVLYNPFLLILSIFFYNNIDNINYQE